MKQLFTLFLVLMCTGLIQAQTPLELNFENEMTDTYVGSVALEVGSTFFLKKFELKAKREQTPDNDGFFSPVEGVDWIVNQSNFSTLDWTGYTETGGWNGDGNAYEVKLTDAWMLKEYSVSIQPYNGDGNVGAAITGNWADFGKKEVKAEYKAEKCATANDSTTAEKWKAEVKLKFENPADPASVAIAPEADSLLIVVTDNDDLVVFSYTASIDWVDPSLFGMNIIASLASPASGTFYVPGETFAATILLTNDGGDTLFLNNTDENKVEKLELWISGPKHKYMNMPGYEGVKVVEKYVLEEGSGYNTSVNGIDVNLPEENLTAGSYTMLIKAKRKGFGPDVEKFLLTDFQVSNETVSSNPTESWATTCMDCHDLEKHGATEVSQCAVCHTNGLTNYELVKIVHVGHATAETPILSCAECHTNSDGNDVTSTLACISCHDGTITSSFPGSHSEFADNDCAMCHDSGDLSPDEAHSSLSGTEALDSPATSLGKSYPNPFRDETRIEFTLSSTSFANLSIFDSNGRKVATLIDKELGAGNHQAKFNGNDLPIGIYFYKLSTISYSETKKMLLVR